MGICLIELWNITILRCTMTKKPIILFTTPVLQHPATGGPALRIENSIKALSQISHLHIYCRAPVEDRSNWLYYESLSVGFYTAPSLRLSSRCIGIAEKSINLLGECIFHRSFFTVDWSKKDAQDLLDTADSIKADLIWLGFGNISYPLLRYIKENSDYKTVCDTDSVWSRFVLRGLPFARDECEKEEIITRGRLKEIEEEWGTKLSDVTTAVSSVDAEYYRNLVSQPQKIKIFSNVVDVEAYKSIPPELQGFLHPCIYLAGTFWPGSPMEEAARWTIREVLPLVKNKIPTVHFYIIGKGSDTTLLDIHESDITITGRLDSVLPYLCHADVALVPLKFESGTRFKILEAGACGIPVVSTTLGAEGLPITHGKDILIADDPEAFANSIVQLILDRNLASSVAENLKKLVADNFGLSKQVDEAKEIIDYLLHDT